MQTLLPFWCPLGNSIKILMCRFSPEFLNIPVLSPSAVHGIAAEREGETISRQAAETSFLLLPSVQATTRSTNQPKSITHVPQTALSYNLQFKNNGWYLKSRTCFSPCPFMSVRSRRKRKVTIKVKIKFLSRHNLSVTRRCCISITHTQLHPY